MHDMKSKTLALIFALILSAFELTSAQSAQLGVALEYKGKAEKQALAGVSVTAANAGSVISDANGEFTLQFRTLKVGDAIQFRRIDLNGYEVMNTEALEVARIARDAQTAQTLQIVLAPRQLLQQLRDGYRSVASQRYQKQLSEAKAEAERLKRVGEMAEEEYNQRMDALEEEYEEKLSKLETYIDKFARIDLSDLDQDEQQIIDLVQEGDFEQALSLYDRQDLANRLVQSRADRQKLAEAQQQLSLAEQQKARENQRLRESIERQILLLRMAGGEENRMKVHEILHQTYLADTTHIETLRDYVRSLVEYDRQEEAITLVRSAMLRPYDTEDKEAFFQHCMLLMELSRIYFQQQDMERSEQLNLEVDSLYDARLASDTKLTSRVLPQVASLLLRQFLGEGALDEAQRQAEKLRLYWNPDSLLFGSLSAYAEVCGPLSDYYSHINDTEQNHWAIETGIELGESLFSRYPWAIFLADNYTTACGVYALDDMRQKAQTTARRAAQLISKELSERRTTQRVINAASDYYQLLESLTGMEEYALADSLIQLQESQRVFAELDERYPGMLDAIHCLYQFSEVQVRLHQGRIAEADSVAQASLAALSTQEEYASLYAQRRPYILGMINDAQGKADEAREFYLEAIRIQEEIYEALEHDAWEADQLCRNYLLMADFCRRQHDKKGLRSYLKLAEKVAVFPYNKAQVRKAKDLR